MSEMTNRTLSGVSETCLAALYLRALESQHPDALLKDEKAETLVKRMSYDFDRVRQIPMTEANKVFRILVTRELDRYARDFLTRHPDGVVVHIGCGLDTRFERVAERNDQVEWYDLDLPEIIKVRRKYVGDEGGRYHLLGYSVLEEAWMEVVSVHRQRPFLFLAEVVFVYFEGAQVKSLVLTLRNRFPGAELVFDACSPLHVAVSNFQFSFSKLNARFHWGIWRGQELEGWAGDIHLLGEWGYLDRSEPRLARFQWLRYIPLVPRAERIYHYQLGKAAE